MALPIAIFLQAIERNGHAIDVLEEGVHPPPPDGCARRSFPTPWTVPLPQTERQRDKETGRDTGGMGSTREREEVWTTRGKEIFSSSRAVSSTNAEADGRRGHTTIHVGTRERPCHPVHSQPPSHSDGYQHTYNCHPTTMEHHTTRSKPTSYVVLETRHDGSTAGHRPCVRVVPIQHPAMDRSHAWERGTYDEEFDDDRNLETKRCDPRRHPTVADPVTSAYEKIAITHGRRTCAPPIALDPCMRLHGRIVPSRPTWFRTLRILFDHPARFGTFREGAWTEEEAVQIPRTISNAHVRRSVQHKATLPNHCNGVPMERTCDGRFDATDGGVHRWDDVS